MHLSSSCGLESVTSRSVDRNCSGSLTQGGRLLAAVALGRPKLGNNEVRGSTTWRKGFADHWTRWFTNCKLSQGASDQQEGNPRIRQASCRFRTFIVELAQNHPESQVAKLRGTPSGFRERGSGWAADGLQHRWQQVPLDRKSELRDPAGFHPCTS